jgi:hypothetical protein
MRDHKHPDVIEAKNNEIRHLQDFDTFKEVKDTGQTKVGSRWVVTGKEKHDGQNTKYKARLVAKGYQKTIKPQADSPTALNKSFKIFNALLVNEDFKMQAIDVRAAFLQSNEIDREIYLESSKDIKKEGIIWKIKKPLYGFDDASRKFWLKVREILKEGGMQNVIGDQAYYYCRENDKLVGMIITHR